MKISIMNRGFTVIKSKIRNAELKAIKENDLKISELQWNYLVWVIENKDKKMGDIAKKLGVQKGTLSNNIKYLVEKGLITKETNGRFISVSATDEGQRYIDIHTVTHKQINDELNLTIGKEDMDNLIRIGTILQNEL